MKSLLDTKLIPPHRRVALLDRPALAARLTRLHDVRLVLACAPAGYGKTSALVQAHEILRGQGARAAWLSLDEGDKDLSRFVAYLQRAIARSSATPGQSALTWREAEVTPTSDTLRTTFLNEIALLHEDVTLLLDDYHLVSDPEIKALVNALLLSPTPRLRLLIASRTHNDLPLSRLRALGLVEEIDVADLMFSAHETEEFVARVRGTPLSPAQAARLCQATEGWAASLQMASIALREVRDVDGFLDRFSGEDGDIGSFLGDEVLRQLPADLQEFMTLISILKRFNGNLCNAVTGGADGRAMIEAIERRSLFLFSLDRDRKWFRYHHLFADYLRGRCAERHADRIPGCHLRAAEWFASQGFMVDAIEHAFEAEAFRLAGSLLDQASSDLFATGQTGTLMALSARLPRDVLEGLPQLQLERAWYSQLSWHFAEARTALQRVQAVLASGNDAEGLTAAARAQIASRLAHRHMMLSVLSDDMREAARQGREWLAHDTGQDAFMSASTGTAMMAAQRIFLRCEGTATSARMLQAKYVEGGARYGVVFHQCVVGNTHFDRGELELAHGAYEHGLQVAVELQGEHSALYNMPALMLGELYYERNELSRCEEVLAQRDIGSRLGFVDNLIAGYTTRARLHALQQRYDEAAELLGEGLWLAAQYGFARMRAALHHEHAWLLGISDAGARAVSQYLPGARALIPVSARDGVNLTDLFATLTAARIALHEGQAREALQPLRSWLTFTRERHCHRAAVRCAVLLARVQIAAGDRRGALRALHEALRFAGPGCMLRTFVDEDAEIATLVDEIAAQAVGVADSSHAERVRQACGGTVGGAPRHGAPFLVGQELAEPLTPREIQILELGASGMQNADIARAAFLAESTVKWYWQRIFEKLGVRRRPDAIRRAREGQWIR